MLIPELIILCLQSIMQVLAKEEENFNNLEKDETRMDIEQASLKFLDIARQLESFFLQKRFVLSALKPELILKEVSSYIYSFIPNSCLPLSYISSFQLYKTEDCIVFSFINKWKWANEKWNLTKWFGIFKWLIFWCCIEFERISNCLPISLNVYKF